MGIFDNKDYYPTPDTLIEQMLFGVDVKDKVVLEPSAGSGNIVDFLNKQGAKVIACEDNDQLRVILTKKCRILANDFLKVTLY